jgi:hypothetical protein
MSSKITPTQSPNGTTSVSSSAGSSFLKKYYQGADGSSDPVTSAAQYLARAEGVKGNKGVWGQPSTSEPQTNYPFDFRIKRIAANGIVGSGAFTPGVQTTTGRMSTVSQLDGKTYEAVFEFNPTEIDLSYGFDDSVSAVLNPSFIANPSATEGTQGLMLNQSVSFTLLFDRTYEVWTGTNYLKSAVARQRAADLRALEHGHLPPQYQTAIPQALSQLANSYGPYKFGVMWDVWAIERLVGIFGQYSGAPPSGPPAAAITNVEFGVDHTGTTIGDSTLLGGGYAFGFTGWMTAFEVQYTRFDASMVPTRCAIGLTFEQIYSLQASSTNETLSVGQTGSNS